MTVTDKPHDNYHMFAPVTGEPLNEGIPILRDVPGGSVVDKEINYKLVFCPECDIEAEYSEDSEPVCPECGLICAGRKQIRSNRIIIDAKSAGRTTQN